MRKHNCLRFLMVMLVAAVILTPPSGASFAQQAAAEDFVVITLGTGDPTPSMKRFGPATLVKAGKEILLFDAGRGAAQRVWKTGTSLGSINGLFLTHLHSDHIVGIPDVWLTGWLPAPFAIRKAPMRVWGPKGTKSMMSGLETAYDWDIRTRIADQKLAKEAVAIDAHEIEQGVVYENNGVKVTAFEVDHGDLIKPCFGYRIDFDGRSVVISGDTKFSENLIKFATGADLLIHQAAMAKDELLQTSIAFRYIIDHHTKPEEAGVVFARTKPKQAALYHIVLLTNGKVPAPTEQDVVDGVKKNYSGPLVVAEDLMRFSISRDGVTYRMP
jgi:ribonuclease Z